MTWIDRSDQSALNVDGEDPGQDLRPPERLAVDAELSEADGGELIANWGFGAPKRFKGVS